MSVTAKDNITTAKAHLAAFPTLVPELPGSGIGWLDALRRNSLRRFEGAGIPDRRLEPWKFTALNVLTQHPFAPGAAGAAPKLAVGLGPEGAAARLVFVDGRFDGGLSDIPPLGEGVTVTNLAAQLQEDPDELTGRISAAKDAAGALWDLNAAFMADGAVVRIAAGAAVENPISLLFLSSGAPDRASHVRNVIVLGKGARAQVVETYAGTAQTDAPEYTNAVTDIALAGGAALTHLRVQDQGSAAAHTSRAVVDIAQGARYESFALALGARLSRQESDVIFSGPDGCARLFGAYLGRGHQHLDHTTRVDHAHPRCETEEIFNGVLDDHAHGVFQGMIRVSPHAVGTDARQKNQTLLLSDRAVADSKPELEILADDVKCAHGAAVGDLDPDALFYLTSRGIPEAEARRLMIGGFIGDVIDRFGGDAVRHLRCCVADWQERHIGGGDD